MEWDELVAAHIEPDPGHPGPADVRLKHYGTHVWALIGYLHSTGWDAERTARDYHIPLEAVEAAVTYYRQYKDIIDGRIDANTAPAA